MPELPEVETVCRGLNHITRNTIIQGGEVLLTRTVAHPIFIEDFWAAITHTAIAQWQRRGKYLLAQLVHPPQPPGDRAKAGSLAGYLGVHLRMTGQLLWVDQDSPVHHHTRVRFYCGQNQELRFVDQRTFGQIWWVPPTHQPAEIITGLQKLGPEPFSPEFSVDYLTTALKGRQRPIKTALLDQSLVAGVGNIYADESLFLSQIHPQTPSGQLSPQQLSQLQQTVIQVLETSINAGGTTFSNFLNVQGVNGNYGLAAWVYNRAGEPCRTCHTPIQRLKLGGRSTHFCPHCQPSAPAGVRAAESTP